MKCINQKNENTCEAVAICKFCGVFLCKDCISRKPYVHAAYDEDKDSPKYLVTEDAVWCGNCNVVPVPISIPESE